MMIKISRLTIFTILAGAFVFPQVIHAEMQKISVYIDNSQIMFDQNPVLFGDTTLVPLRGVFEKLGAKVEWNGSTQTVKVIKEDKTLTLKSGSKDAFSNNTLLKMSTEPQILNNRIMVPLRFISETLEAQVDWDSTTNIINISKPSIVNSNDVSINNAKNSNTLTYSDALQKTLAYSFVLKNAKKEIDKADEARKDYGEYFRYSTPFGTGNSAAEANIRQLYLGMLSANDKIRKAERDLITAGEEVTYQVKQAYNDVIQKESIKLYNEKVVGLEEINYKNAKVQLKQGVISKAQYELIENKLEGSKKTLDASEKALTQAKTKLNQLMGVENDVPYVLVDIPKFGIMSDVDVDYHITKTLENHPTIFELELAKDLAQKSIEYYAFNSNAIGENYDTKKITVSTISNQLAQTKDSISEGVRSIFLNIRSLEDQYAALKSNLANAENNLQIAKAQYEVGQTTELEIRQKELQVAELNSKLNEIVITLDNLHEVFKKPWVTMGPTTGPK